MKELLQYLISSLLNKNIEDIELHDQETPDEHFFLVKLDPTDIGFVIGKKGAVIKAIRQLLAIKAAPTQKRVTIKIEPRM